MAKKPKIGSKWRFSAHGPNFSVELESVDQHHVAIKRIEPNTVFDELAVDNWFHMEQMDKNLWWIRIGNENRMVRIHKNGEAEIGEAY